MLKYSRKMHGGELWAKIADKKLSAVFVTKNLY